MTYRKNILVLVTLFLISIFASSWSHASGSNYLIEYTYYDGLGEKMREEIAYEIIGSSKKVVQERIYKDEGNELREVAFPNKDGSWTERGTELPDDQKQLFNLINSNAKRVEVQRPRSTYWDVRKAKNELNEIPKTSGNTIKTLPSASESGSDIKKSAPHKKIKSSAIR